MCLVVKQTVKTEGRGRYVEGQVPWPGGLGAVDGFQLQKESRCGFNVLVLTVCLE